MEIQENKAILNVNIGEPIKRFNFEVSVDFSNEDQHDKYKTAEILCLIISAVNIYNDDYKKYIDLMITSYAGVTDYEKHIPYINKINICRNDSKGNLLLTEVYENCKFIGIYNSYDYSCGEFNDSHNNKNIILKPIYKFEYQTMRFDDKYYPPFRLREGI